VLEVLRAGGTGQAAAEAAGTSVRALARIAIRDGELAAALDGRPVSDQLAARRSDFLAALERTRGDEALAAYAIALAPGQPEEWRRTDAEFAAAAAVVRAQAAAPGPPQVSDRRLDRAAWLLERRVSMAAAARAIGVSPATLRNRAHSHRRLAAALPPVQGQGRAAP